MKERLEIRPNCNSSPRRLFGRGMGFPAPDRLAHQASIGFYQPSLQDENVSLGDLSKNPREIARRSRSAVRQHLVTHALGSPARADPAVARGARDSQLVRSCSLSNHDCFPSASASPGMCLRTVCAGNVEARGRSLMAGRLLTPRTTALRWSEGIQREGSQGRPGKPRKRGGRNPPDIDVFRVTGTSATLCSLLPD